MTLLEKAIVEVENLKSGEEFYVKDLFKGYVWNRLYINDRRNLGRDFFRSDLNSQMNVSIKACGKNSANQQKYIKL